LPQRGGKRKGAGRKRTAARPRVSHKRRAEFDNAAPVLVTLRVAPGVWNLRSRRCFRIVEDCFAGARTGSGCASSSSPSLETISISWSRPIPTLRCHEACRDSGSALRAHSIAWWSAAGGSLTTTTTRGYWVPRPSWWTRLRTCWEITRITLAVRLPRGIRSALLHTTWYDARRSCRAREPGFYVMAGVAHVGSRRGSPGGL